MKTLDSFEELTKKIDKMDGYQNGVFFRFDKENNCVIIGTIIDGKLYKAPVYLDDDIYDYKIKKNEGDCASKLEILLELVRMARQVEESPTEWLCVKNIAKSNVAQINAMFGGKNSDKEYEKLIKQYDTILDAIPDDESFETGKIMSIYAGQTSASRKILDRNATRQYVEALICEGRMKKVHQGTSEKIKQGNATHYIKCPKGTKECKYWKLIEGKMQCTLGEKKFRAHKKGEALPKEEE